MYKFYIVHFVYPRIDRKIRVVLLLPVFSKEGITASLRRGTRAVTQFFNVFDWVSSPHKKVPIQRVFSVSPFFVCFANAILRCLSALRARACLHHGKKTSSNSRNDMLIC